MKYKKQIVLGVIFIIFAGILLVTFITRNHKFNEYAYIKFSPLDYSVKYKEFSSKGKNITVYKIKMIDKTAEQIVESKNWDDWEGQMNDKTYDDLEKELLFTGDEELTMNLLNGICSSYYIPKKDKNKMYLSSFSEYEKLIYIAEIENKEV